MTLEFIYFKELEAFIQILLLGSVLSFIVCYAVECLKTTGITQKWFYLMSSILLSAVFGFGFAKTFTEMTTYEGMWLSLCLWLGSQGFYDTLEQSNGFIGKRFKSLSERLGEVVVTENETTTEKPKEEVSENETYVKENLTTDKPIEETKEEDPIDDEETDEPKAVLPKAETRNVNANQIKVLVSDLRIRKEPKGDILGYATKNGYYTYSDMVEKDGIKWYKVGDCYIGDSGSGDLAVCKAGDYMIFPLKQYVTVTTNFSKSHPAIDFGWSSEQGGRNQLIIAPYDMKVVRMGYDKTVGNYVYSHIVYEGKKYTLRFIHLSEIGEIEVGNTVKRGSGFAKMGNTGTSSNGSHLHFDIWEGHLTSMPNNRYENSYNALKMCYAEKSQPVNSSDLKEYGIKKV